MSVRLHVNVDHVATLRQARGTLYPDPVQAALICERAGAEGITVHLREDRRHIQDEDVRRLRLAAKTYLNLEMAATSEMVAIAKSIKPDLVTLVPERREERTTEGGLDVNGQLTWITDIRVQLERAGVPVSLFIDPSEKQAKASIASGVAAVEFHTGDYANATGDKVAEELHRLAHVARFTRGESNSIRIAAGHGLTVQNVPALLQRVPDIIELNIGHALISDAVYVGMAEAVKSFLQAIESSSKERSC